MARLSSSCLCLVLKHKTPKTGISSRQYPYGVIGLIDPEAKSQMIFKPIKWWLSTVGVKLITRRARLGGSRGLLPQKDCKVARFRPWSDWRGVISAYFPEEELHTPNRSSASSLPPQVINSNLLPTKENPTMIQIPSLTSVGFLRRNSNQLVECIRTVGNQNLQAPIENCTCNMQFCLPREFHKAFIPHLYSKRAQ